MAILVPCVAERHDLGNALLAVLSHAVAQYVGAAVLIEVDVDIGQRDTLGVEETLEQQVVFQRVDIGDLQAVGDHRTRGRTTARPTETPISRAARM